MAEPLVIIEHAWVREAAPRGTARLARLLDRAVELADLSAVDVFTLGDWIAPLEPEAAEDLGILLVALFLAVSEGSLAVELSVPTIRRRLEDLAAFGELDWWIERALAALRGGKFEHVIGIARPTPSPSGTPGGEGSPLLIWTSGGREFLYFQKYLRAEQDLDVRLQQLAGRPSRVHAKNAVPRVFREVLETSPLVSNGKPVTWDVDQLTAFGLAILRDVVIISGGPGTGKTSVVLTLLRCLVRLGIKADRIALAAPTGRAAQRLSDSLRSGLESWGENLPAADRLLKTRTATTLHSLLEYNPGRNLFRRHEENPVAADVVVVDEVSMVSVEQMASLLKALAPETRLILLGDKDQLPSVDAGAVLAQLVPDSDAPALSEPVRRQIEAWLPTVGAMSGGGNHWLRDAVVMLRTNHRSEKGIRDAATSINALQADIVDALPHFVDWASANRGCMWWEQTQATAAELRGQLHSWAEHVYDTPFDNDSTFFLLANERTLVNDDLAEPETHSWLRRLWRAVDRTRLLTLVREGPWGCGPINEALAAWLRRRSGVGRDREWLPGTPILITRNDKVRGLFNGDVGLTVAGPNGESRVVFARQGGFVSLSPGNLPSHELGFALTVHKSQGSEFQEAFVVLPPTGGRRLLTKELIYTAITRAKRLAVVSGTGEAFRTAVGRRIVRESGMRPVGQISDLP